MASSLMLLFKKSDRKSLDMKRSLKMLRRNFTRISNEIQVICNCITVEYILASMMNDISNFIHLTIHLGVLFFDIWGGRRRILYQFCIQASFAPQIKIFFGIWYIPYAYAEFGSRFNYRHNSKPHKQGGGFSGQST